MAVRVGLFLSGLAGVVLLMWASAFAVTGADPFWVIFLYAAIAWGAALAVIWLGVFVVRVVAKAIRVTDEARQL